MEVSREVLDEVILHANKEIKESQQSQMSMLRLKTKDVKEVPAIFGEKDVIKTLQLLPGIHRGSEGVSNFFVRRGTPDQNLIILDDAPVYNSNHLFGFLSVFNGDAIKSIEMYKGGFPTRFGGRLSSVLKIDTKNGNKEKLKGKLSVGLVSTSAVLEGPIKKGKTSFLFSGRRTYLDLLLKPFSNSATSSLFNFTDFNFKIHHVFNDKNKLYWSNYYGNDHLSISEPTENGVLNNHSSLNWGNITSTLRWNHEFSDTFFSNTSFIYSNYNLQVKNKYTTEKQENIFNLKSGINDFGLKMDFDYYPNPKHLIKFGFASTYHHFTPKQSRLEQSSGDNAAFKQDIKSLESALYAEDDWKLSNSLRFSGGFRFSHYKHKAKTYMSFKPRATLSWNVQPNLAVKASYANMNQYIHLLTNANAGLPTDIWVSSTENLKPQKSEQFALGIAKDFVDKGYTFTLEGYYKKMDNIISYKEGTSFITLENSMNAKEINWEKNITNGQGWAYGTELLFRKNIGKVTGWLGYTLSWSERQFDEINKGKRFFAKYDRRHDISLVSVYKPSENIVLSGSWVFSSGDNFNLLDREALTGLNNSLIPNDNSISTVFKRA